MRDRNGGIVLARGHCRVHGRGLFSHSGYLGGQSLGRVGLGMRQQQQDQCQWALLTKCSLRGPVLGPRCSCIHYSLSPSGGAATRSPFHRCAKASPGNSHLGIASGRGFQDLLFLSSRPVRVMSGSLLTTQTLGAQSLVPGLLLLCLGPTSVACR